MIDSRKLRSERCIAVLRYTDYGLFITPNPRDENYGLLLKAPLDCGLRKCLILRYFDLRLQLGHLIEIFISRKVILITRMADYNFRMS